MKPLNKKWEGSSDKKEGKIWSYRNLQARTSQGKAPLLVFLGVLTCTRDVRMVT